MKKVSIARTISILAIFLVIGLNISWNGNGNFVKQSTLPELMPPHPRLIEMAKEGKASLPEAVSSLTLKRSQGIDQPVKAPQHLSGTFKVLALLVDFPDKPAATSPSFFDNLLFGDSFGTLRNYYQTVSYGNLTLTTENMPSSIGWLRLPQTLTYYVGGYYGLRIYPNNAQKMVEDAVALADPRVDFSKYDNDGDGVVDGLIVIHAGCGAEWYGCLNEIWSHQWVTNTPLSVDGKTVYPYSTEPEYWSSPNDMTVGVFAHEVGHLFGLPDLYDTDYSSEGVGEWSLMGGGSWNGVKNMGESPAWPDAWSRLKLGWSNVDNVMSERLGAVFSAAETSPTVTRLFPYNNTTGKEYFLIENRQAYDYDAYLPGQGLLIWHVDENIGSNNLECAQVNNWVCSNQHYKVALEQADGNFDLECSSGYCPNRGDSGDPYPGSTNNRIFNAVSRPNSSSYYSSSGTGISVVHISNSAMTMTADLNIDLIPLFLPFVRR